MMNPSKQCPRCASFASADATRCACGHFFLDDTSYTERDSADGDPPPSPRPVSVTVAIAVLLLAALLPTFQTLLGGAGRPVALVATVWIVPVVGLIVNGVLAILLLKPRLWAIVLAALRGAAGAIWSVVQLFELRTQWGEWSISFQSGIMVWLVVNATLSAAISLTLFSPSSLRWPGSRL